MDAESGELGVSTVLKCRTRMNRGTDGDGPCGSLRSVSRFAQIWHEFGGWVEGLCTIAPSFRASVNAIVMIGRFEVRIWNGRVRSPRFGLWREARTCFRLFVR
jgi:hypothetical protein